jgi:SH3-like domain-containing protein
MTSSDAGQVYMRNIALGGWFRAVLAVMAMAVLALPAAASSELATGASSGLPVPRFVSLKPDKVNVRAGPTRTHDVTWQFTRSGLPVEITAESDNWRRIRDWEGSEGWVYHSLLSGRRTAMVISKAKDELVPLFGAADEHGPVVARLQPGVSASVRKCTGKWCQINGAGFDGWIVQERLWGVYPNELVP